MCLCALVLWKFIISLSLPRQKDLIINTHLWMLMIVKFEFFLAHVHEIRFEFSLSWTLFPHCKSRIFFDVLYLLIEVLLLGNLRPNWFLRWLDFRGLYVKIIVFQVVWSAWRWSRRQILWIRNIKMFERFMVYLHVLKWPLECLIALIATHHAPSEWVEIVIGSWSHLTHLYGSFYRIWFSSFHLWVHGLITLLTHY